MSKPDWKDAPEWANYLAQDMPGVCQDEYWVWFEKRPTLLSNGWLDPGLGKWLQTEAIAELIDWKETLEPRP